MLQLGIGAHFIFLVKSLLCGAWSRALVNGMWTEDIQVLQGVRQGCPLSPLLFAMLTQPLMDFFRGETDAGRLQGLAPSPSLRLSFRLFADDLGTLMKVVWDWRIFEATLMLYWENGSLGHLTTFLRSGLNYMLWIWVSPSGASIKWWDEISILCLIRCCSVFPELWVNWYILGCCGVHGSKSERTWYSAQVLRLSLAWTLELGWSTPLSNRILYFTWDRYVHVSQDRWLAWYQKDARLLVRPCWHVDWQGDSITTSARYKWEILNVVWDFFGCSSRYTFWRQWIWLSGQAMALGRQDITPLCFGLPNYRVYDMIQPVSSDYSRLNRIW